jgi:uncharacterized lipoprotein YddW (UPF0748 family)
MKVRSFLLLFISCFTLFLFAGCAIQKPGVKEKVVQGFPVVQREFRAAWVATVANINWPSKPGLTTEQQKEEAITLLDLLKDHNFNAAIFQVRPQCDALYKSELEPWSYYLTGQQGKAPNPYYDPLEFWIKQAHDRGIELHVWLNPYRAHHVSGGEVTEVSIVKKRPELVVKLKKGYYWLDPAIKKTQDHSYDVVMDILKRYDIDGVHFDDYFYPYPSYNNNEDFPDDKTWQVYKQKGGKLSRGDWRREAVNNFIKRLYKGIKKEKSHVKFGLSPFGIWRPFNPESIRGFDQYKQLYADARLWLNEGWIDYWTPQLYWPVNQIPQSYPVLLGWWKKQNKKQRHFWPGISIGRKKGDAGIDETINQIMITRGMLPESPGNVHWSIGPMVSSEKLVRSISQGPYKQQALIPASPWLDKEAPKAPQVTTVLQKDSLKINWSHENGLDVFHWVFYYKYGSAWNYKILNRKERSTTIPLFVLKNRNIRNDKVNEKNIKKMLQPITQIAVSAVDRVGNESAPVQVSISGTSTAQITSFEKYFTESKPNFHLSCLDEEYENFKFCNIPAKELKNKNVIDLLQKLKDQFPLSFHYEKVGCSVQNRPIHLARLGKGKRKILLWSQMHGDEPTATVALFDIFYYLLKNTDKSFVQDILKNTTILAVPMLNPDGAEKFTRRNAQGLDINRDARDLQSPEAKILFQLQEKYQPDFGFNLHDQNARTTVGKTNRLAALALQAPPFEARDRDNAVRIRAKKIVSVICQALAPHLSGFISKYGADYMPRSFGDSMQNWGVSTVLIESSGWHTNRDEFLQKMNFIALISAFNAIAYGSYKQADTTVYDSLPENGKNLYDLLIQDVMVIDGTGIPPFRADIAINYNSKKVGTFADMGDLNVYAARDTINGIDLTLTPGFVGVIHNAKLTEKVIVNKSKNLIKKGCTTILFSARKEQMKRFRDLKQLFEGIDIPVNVGAILHFDSKMNASIDTLQVLRLLENNLVGIISDKNILVKSDSAKFLKKPVVALAEVNQNINLKTLDFQTIKKFSLHQTKLWKIPNRGQIRRGQIADFVLFSTNPESRPVVNSIFIKGHRIWQDGDWIKTSVKGERKLPF